MKKFIMTIVIIAALCVTGVILVLLAGNYMFNFALNQKYEKGFVPDGEGIDLTETTQWLYSSAEEEFIRSSDGLKLHGYFIPSNSSGAENNVYVLLVHGYKSNPTAMTPYGFYYAQKGWNILIPSQRSHWKSDGQYIGMGILEHGDMRLWIDFILSKNKDAKILVHGVSMGAATVMLLSGRDDIPENVHAIIEDCGYSGVEAQFKNQLKDVFGLPSFPILNAASFVTKIRAGYDFADGNCLDSLSNAKVPMLFIHGTEDDFVRFDMLETNFNAASCPKEKLIVPGAHHANSVDTDPKLYWNSVEEFLSKYF